VAVIFLFTPVIAGPGPDIGGAAAPSSRTNWLWAELMHQSFSFDVLACPRCGDRLALVALIEDRW
jgi:hypothetical protein